MNYLNKKLIFFNLKLCCNKKVFSLKFTPNYVLELRKVLKKTIKQGS